ncbi:MAG: ankyrin repeat domain-containing protein [Marinibacterium sp.]
MSQSTDQLRRAAKALKKALDAEDPRALARARVCFPDTTTFRHADALHVIAREEGFDSWPKLKAAREAEGLDRGARAKRLGEAVFHGQCWVIEKLLDRDPDLRKHSMALACALYDTGEVRRRITTDPGAATRAADGKTPIMHLAFSRYHQCGGNAAAMLDVAETLVAAGADVNDAMAADPVSDHALSVLYGAIGHGDNMVLADWLLQQGANPDDNESLYHATELGHLRGLDLLLAHGAQTKGTNALLRALDFDNAEMVEMLLKAGADPNEGVAPHPSDQPATVIPALHQAARRMCSLPVVRPLLDHGADPSAVWGGHTAYGLARIHGNRALAEALEAAGAGGDLTPIEAQLARAADDRVGPRDWIDMDLLSAEARRLLCRLVWRPGTDAHMARLVAMGFDPNEADEMGLTPLHLAGWEGLADRVGFFLRQQPDLGHVNRYGGTLFSTILHGSENCPGRAGRDHVACMELVLREGVALPRKALAAAGSAEMSACLADWAARHPGQVVENGAY